MYSHSKLCFKDYYELSRKPLGNSKFTNIEAGCGNSFFPLCVLEAAWGCKVFDCDYNRRYIFTHWIKISHLERNNMLVSWIARFDDVRGKNNIFADNFASVLLNIGNLIYLRNGNDMMCIFSLFLILFLFGKCKRKISRNCSFNCFVQFCLAHLMCWFENVLSFSFERNRKPSSDQHVI
jgi:hypothetical protein